MSHPEPAEGSSEALRSASAELDLSLALEMTVK
jgi:hypothetical protein